MGVFFWLKRDIVNIILARGRLQQIKHIGTGGSAMNPARGNANQGKRRLTSSSRSHTYLPFSMCLFDRCSWNRCRQRSTPINSSPSHILILILLRNLKSTASE